MKINAKITSLFLIVTALAFFLFGCSEMSVTTPAPTTSVVTPNIDTSHSTSPSTGESTVVDPTSMPPSILTPTPTPDNTGDPRYDSADAIGPLSFGENSYKIYLGDSLVIFNTDKTVFCDLGAVTILDRNLFILSASFMDINFDEVPDFSYFEPDGRRICYLGDAQNGGFFYNDTLSSLYNLTRCYETYELFATESQDAEIYYSYKFENGELIRGDALTDRFFVWDITTISEALAGSGASVTEADDAEIRGINCKTYTVGGYLTIALDSYGNFYIKDMPHKGFCRISLNPNGRWSKSEKVTPDTI
jgi:hypothetical protein